MKKLNLLAPKTSEIQFEKWLFPDGQPHLRLAPEARKWAAEGATILTRMASPADVLMAFFAKNALEGLGFRKIRLDISYLLAARMDRRMTEGEPFSLKTIGQLIDAGGFEEVRILDPHSDVAAGCIARSEPISNVHFVEKAIEKMRSSGWLAGDFALVSPDAGALKKVWKVAEKMGRPVVECLKTRDPKTGRLSGFRALTDGRLDGQTLVIVDDICDGGGTFAGLAAELRRLGAERVGLVGTHGIFSKGLKIDGIDATVTTDSFRDFSGVEACENFCILPCQEFF